MDLHLIKSKTDQKLHKNHSEKKFPILCVYRQTASPMCQKYANDVLISPQGLIIHWLRTKHAMACLIFLSAAGITIPSHVHASAYRARYLSFPPFQRGLFVVMSVHLASKG